MTDIPEIQVSNDIINHEAFYHIECLYVRVRPSWSELRFNVRAFTVKRQFLKGMKWLKWLRWIPWLKTKEGRILVERPELNRQFVSGGAALPDHVFNRPQRPDQAVNSDLQRAVAQALGEKIAQAVQKHLAGHTFGVPAGNFTITRD